MTWYSDTIANFEDLIGKTLVKIEVLNDYDDMIRFWYSDKSYFEMRHDQDCCESVGIKEIVGNLDDLLNSPILIAYESSTSSSEDKDYETWTFYNISTINGSVNISWLGSSNGYYSESVNFYNFNMENN
jgi:hypothetical protein